MRALRASSNEPNKYTADDPAVYHIRIFQPITATLLEISTRYLRLVKNISCKRAAPAANPGISPRHGTLGWQRGWLSKKFPGS